MIYQLYKLSFSTGVHIGDGTLYGSRNTFGADVLFSALCIEAVKRGDKSIEKLLEYVNNGSLVISDALPYIMDRLFIPKPIMHIEQRSNQSEILSGKVYKKVKYIDIEDFDEYMNGSFDVSKALDEDCLGYAETRDNVAIRGLEESLPYRVGVYNYRQGSGLYIIIGVESEQVSEFFEELIVEVALAGIGGKRNSGLGKFEVIKSAISNEFVDRLSSKFDYYMLLSAGLPNEEDMDRVIKGASFKISVRSGFVQSDTYSDGYLRKKDTYLIDTGSVVKEPFEGQVINVASKGNHPVYRYAKPLLLGVRG